MTFFNSSTNTQFNCGTSIVCKSTSNSETESDFTKGEGTGLSPDSLPISATDFYNISNGVPKHSIRPETEFDLIKSWFINNSLGDGNVIYPTDIDVAFTSPISFRDLDKEFQENSLNTQTVKVYPRL